MKTFELTGAALDWAVAMCEGYSSEQAADIIYCDSAALAYSTDWSQGGPIIERERITLDGTAILGQWMAVAQVPNDEPWETRGPTPLVAAMRCYVASRLGDEVDIPEELQ